MKIYIVFLAALPFLAADDALLDYYEDLINAEIKRAASYQFPKDASNYRPTNSKPKDFGSFDFVVIGAGSAGAIAASRLSEVTSWKVLLLEAGTKGSNFSEVPAMLPYLTTLEYNWGFNSTPQAACCQATGGICPYPRGRSLGGSTTINALVYSRGNKADYDKWALMANSEWSYENVLPYFIKSENSHVEGDHGYHGFDGCLNVENFSSTSKKVDVFLAAHQELGRPTIDVNGKSQIGASYNNFNTINGRRLSTEKAFLRSRSNLVVLTEAYVEKVLIDDVTKAVTGVQFSRNNTRYIAKVDKEVVLSAGAFGSPHILMHSGVGPKNHLKVFNISVIQDLEVGRNMHDHLSFFNIYFNSNTSDTLYPLRESLRQYLNGTGPLTIATNPQGISFFQLAENNSTAPDFELVFIPYIDLNGFVDVESGIIHGTVDRKVKTTWKRSLGEEIYISQFVLILLHPKTRGTIYLQSSDPFVYPLIDSKCFCDKNNEDLERLLQGINKTLELLDTNAFKSIGAQLLPEPRCAMHKFNSRDYWLCSIKLTSMNAYHSGGTCHMGPDWKNGAVVDGKLKVYGIKKLRVADASVIPVTISGHMSAPSMMVGERVADFIKLDYNV